MNPSLLFIASGKGGVGKTWLSTGLALLWSRQKLRTLLVDGDLGAANIDVQMGFRARWTLADVLAKRCTLQQAVSAGVDSHLHVIAGKSGMNAVDLMSAERLMFVREALHRLSCQYAYSLLDLGAGLGTGVRSWMKICHKGVIVITPDPSSLTDGYAAIKTIRSLCPHMQSVGVVVNMAESDHEGQQTYSLFAKSCQKLLNFSPTLLGVVLWDDRIRSCMRKQTHVFDMFPTGHSADQLRHVSRGIEVL